MFGISIKLKKTVVLFVLLGGIFCGISAGAFFAITRDLPQIRSLKTFKPPEISRIYSKDNILLAEIYKEKRDYITLNKIPYHLKAALIATEDRNFYKHSGVDLKGILRAIIKDISAGKYVEGASTISQQLAKTLFLTNKKTLQRKIKEAFLSLQLERRYTKDEILELYLNQVYFGSGAYGVESAARIFFGKSVMDLDLSECALIAAMPKAPSRYSPLINKKLAVKQRNIVLKQMKDIKIITEQICIKTVRSELVLAKKSTNSVKAPYFVEYIKKFLEKNIGSAMLYEGGVTIFTTLSFKKQNIAEQAVKKNLVALEGRMHKNGIRDYFPQCAFIALDVETGGILAMIGGRDFYKSPFNRAVEAKRQPGSAFKPVVYACAIENGFSQNMMMLDAPVIYKGGKKNSDWNPENFSKNYMGEITLRKALSLSKNIPAVRLIEMIGPLFVAKFGYDLGFHTDLNPNLSLALGTSEVALIDLTSAYTVFANMGEKVLPFGVFEVVDRHGRIIWQVKPYHKIVMSRAGAAIMTNMLEGVIREGTGRKARNLECPVGGKTGTTDNYKDALFIGFSPSIAAGIWIGNDSQISLGKGETGAKAALPVWIDFMNTVISNKPCRQFDVPEDTVLVRINSETGRLADENVSDGVTALFLKGTEP